MSIKARIERLESAPPRDNSLGDRIAAARARLALHGIVHEHTPLTEDEERQVKGKRLAYTLNFVRQRHEKKK